MNIFFMHNLLNMLKTFKIQGFIFADIAIHIILEVVVIVDVVIVVCLHLHR